METATLWNSPLFMTLLSGLYVFTGESLLVARSLSFFLALASLVIFHRLTGLLTLDLRTRIFVATLLVFDLTFSRAANTARMDALTFFFFLGALYCFALSYRARAHEQVGDGNRRSLAVGYALMAGLCTGLAATSHPIAIILMPVALAFTLPRIKLLLAAILGSLPPLGAWLVYIVSHWDVFLLQFGSQLGRKAGLLNFFSGETGGSLIVYASQYGGTRPVMGAVLSLVALVLLFGLRRSYLYLRPGNNAAFPERFFARLFLAFTGVFFLVLTSSEAWYALYVGPFLLLLALGLSRLPSGRLGPEKFALVGVAAFFLLSSAWFLYRMHARDAAVQTTRIFSERVLQALERSRCRRVLLRVRPDPYFQIREHLPGVQALEFIPSRLQFKGAGFSPEQKYDPVDCFLLDENHAWAPELTRYLRARESQFQKRVLPARKPLSRATLWRRSPGEQTEPARSKSRLKRLKFQRRNSESK